MPAAVIFDHDGTLLETESAWWRAEAVLFDRYGTEFGPEHKRYLLGSSPQRLGVLLAEVLGRPQAEATALSDELYGLAVEEVTRGVEPMPGAVELLHALRDARVPVGLASNAKRVFLDAALGGAGIEQGWFGVVLAGDEVTRPKPQPDLFLLAAQALGAEPEDCLVLEDSPTGVAAAKAAGMAVVGVPSVEGVELEAADLVVESLADARVAELAGLVPR
jgi:HAD superfamily hydrolase (TIGR01509 family)